VKEVFNMRVKSYGRLEQEVRALEDQVKFYEKEIESLREQVSFYQTELEQVMLAVAQVKRSEQ